MLLLAAWTVVPALAVTPLAGRALAAEESLQLLLERAQPGDTVTIPPGEYMGPLRVTKPIILEAAGEVRLVASGEEAVLTVQSDGATVRGLTIVDERESAPAASLVVEGSGNRVEHLEIRTLGTGVRLQNANHNTLQHLRVYGLVAERGANEAEGGGNGHDHAARPSGAERQSPLKKKNGIELYASHDNQLRANQIVNVLDGVYLENSNNNHVEHNQVVRSRYGYHLMGTHATTLLANTGSENVAGAMVMTSTDALVKENHFFKQLENPHSLGILLFAVSGATVEANRVEGNRVGIYVEKSQENQLTGNELLHNYIGLQVKEAADNIFTANVFVSNVIQAQAQDSTANRFDGNYWDDLDGLDLDGDGSSNLPYEVNPFFLALTSEVPPYQLFFQAPGYVFLERLFVSDADTAVRDEAPLMQPPHQAHAEAASGMGGRRTDLVLVSALLLMGSCLIMYKGVRRS